VTSLSGFVAMMDSGSAQALRLCAGQPDQAHVRKALLAVEKQIHVTEGWDAPLRLFFLRKHLRSGRVSYTPFDKFTNLIHELCATRGARPPDALEYLADIIEQVRTWVDSGATEPTFAGKPIHSAEVAEIFAGFMSRCRPREDMFSCVPGQEFHGVGFVMEGWQVFAEDLPEEKAVEALADDHRLHTHPRRMESRQIHFFARDGWAWDVIRVRHTDTVKLPRYCIAHNPESDMQFGGVITVAMSRICNGIASNPVPIRQY